MIFNEKRLTLTVLFAIALSGCNSDEAKTELHKTGHRIDTELKKTEEHVKDGLDKIKDSVKDVKHDIENAALEASLQNKFHLLKDDAVYVTEHHKNQVKYVLSINNPILSNVDFNFSVTPIPQGWDRMLAHPMPWTPKAETNVKRMLGQIAFVINTQEFSDRFNTAGTGLMNPNAFASGIDDARNSQVSYAIFKDVVNKMTAKWENNGNSTYTISAYGRVFGGNAYGMLGEPKVFLSLHDMSDTSTLHHNASLLLHELTHTFGYSHDGFNDMTPNNIPYYVQAITWDDGMNDIDCDRFMSYWQQGPQTFGAHCNMQGLDLDPSTQTPVLTDNDGRKYRDINLFARFFGNSDVAQRITH
ncbi:hypothetical protein [Vibrio mediterranei]|uniref:hypothetical protein n=1 Tax=Vibrio mediterranei TaxID=689 RepID=UPI00148B7FD9|nr:hypothetical protein [Vibrio mediterranei]NOI26830.1 hypothetical protein [Vibrio mediterranei]